MEELRQDIGGGLQDGTCGTKIHMRAGNCNAMRMRKCGRGKRMSDEQLQ